MGRVVALFGLVALVIGANGRCQTVYSGICPGASSCKCTYGASCSVSGNHTEFEEKMTKFADVAPENRCTATGGRCETFSTGRCPGASSCQYTSGSSCGGSPPPPPSGGSGAFGIDASGSTSESVFNCLSAQGVTYVYMRIFHSYGKPDSAGIQAIKNARAAGIPEVGGYIFPDVKKGNPAGQIASVASALRSAGVSADWVWLDVERHAWHSSTSENQAFLKGLVNAAKSHFSKVGIYSSHSQWIPLFGSSFTFGSELPLWYADYDGVKNFNDFRPFGGWSRPSIKQYKGDSNICGANADLNWRP